MLFSMPFVFCEFKEVRISIYLPDWYIRMIGAIIDSISSRLRSDWNHNSFFSFNLS